MSDDVRMCGIHDVELDPEGFCILCWADQESAENNTKEDE